MKRYKTLKKELVKKRIDRERSEVELNEKFMKRAEVETRLNELIAKRIKNEISLQEIDLKLKLIDHGFTKQVNDIIEGKDKIHKDHMVS